MGLLDELKANYIRYRFQGVMVDILARGVDEFTPSGLEEAIKKGWSLVDFLQGLSVTELRDFLMSVPSAKSAPLMDPTPLRQGLDRITLKDLMDDITKKIPRHGTVLVANPKWIALEVSKAKAFFG